IVATADRGLCGGFNSSIAKAAKERARSLEAEGKKVKLYTIGKKGREQLRYDYKDHLIRHHDTTGKKQPEFSDADTVTRQVLAWFEAGEIDSCSIVYNRFINPITQTVTFQQLIPLQVAESKEDQASEAPYEYEPGEEAVLNSLLPRNVSVQVYRGLLENAASEQGARMTAMDNATRNAGDMIGKLTLQYNRTRQAAITKELIEIISGAEAL
ncbi:MAG: ATP synthase F1 subunit gamma, partial [Rickettsiales bacterium]|nr:ATP synthase F1 subunit gamma [Rickettsiales bacterium]